MIISTKRIKKPINGFLWPISLKLTSWLFINPCTLYWPKSAKTLSCHPGRFGCSKHISNRLLHILFIVTIKLNIWFQNSWMFAKDFKFPSKNKTVRLLLDDFICSEWFQNCFWMISNVLDDNKDVSVFPDEFKYSRHFRMISNAPISKLSGNFQMISGFQDIPGFFQSFLGWFEITV